MRLPYVRALADRGPGRVEHWPPYALPPTIIATCAHPDGCSSAIAMPPGTPAEQQDQRLVLSGWADSPTGPICPCDHPRRAAGVSLRVRLAIQAALWTAAAAIGIALNLSGAGSVVTAAATFVILASSTLLLFAWRR